MKFETERRAFLRALTAAVDVMERRQTIPILGHVYLSAGSDGLVIRATDQDIEATDRIAATVARPGETTISGVLLLDIVKQLPDGALISVEVGSDDRAVIKAGRSRFLLDTLPARDFPAVATDKYHTQFEIGTAALSRLLTKAKFAICTDEIKYYLNGIFLHIDGDKLRSWATDGHRLAQVDVTAPVGAAGMPGVIIPRKTVDKIIKALGAVAGDVMVSVSETKVRVSTDSMALVSKVVDGSFPDCARIIPQGKRNQISVDASELAQAIGRVSAVTTKFSNAVKAEFTADSLTLSASGGGNVASDMIATGYDGPDGFVGFNGKYLVEIMAQVEDMAVIDLGEPGDPLLIKDADDAGVLYLCMPLRVS